MERIPASIGILTYNSAENLERCLKSVQGFSDIIAADGGSTDGTLDILARYSVRVIPQSNPGHPIADFALERNRLLVEAQGPWFFYLDSDEIMSPELKEHIRTVATAAEHPYVAYRVRYLKTNADGTKPYRTYREYYQVRLVRTDIGAQFVRKVHERIELPPGSPVGQTEAPWYVPLDAGDLSIRTFTHKAWARTRKTAEEWHPQGLEGAFSKVVKEPAVLIAKSLLKLVLVRIKWGREAIPVKYELLRILYAFFLFVRHLQRLMGRFGPY